MKRRSPPLPVLSPMQIVALCLMILLLLFLIAVYFITPNPTSAQRDLIRALYPFLAGFAAFFIGGTAFLFIDYRWAGGFRLTLSATAGLAIFLLVYFYPPYWYKAARDESPRSTPTPAPNSGVASSPTPGAPITTPSTPAVAALTPSPRPSFEAATSPTPRATIASYPKPLPTTQASTPSIVVQKVGRVLLLLEDDVIVRALTRRLSDYGLDVMAGTELPGVELSRIREALPQVQAGNQAAGLSIPFAVVVMGKISATSLGFVQGAYMAEANGTLRAIVITSGETLRETLSPIRGGGNAPDAALRNALREAGDNIPQIFISQIAGRAR